MWRSLQEPKRRFDPAPIFPSFTEGGRIEAHIFVPSWPTARAVVTPTASVLEKFCTPPTFVVHLPISDGGKVVLTGYSQPELELDLFLRNLKLELLPTGPPKITAAAIPSS